MSDETIETTQELKQEPTTEQTTSEAIAENATADTDQAPATIPDQDEPEPAAEFGADRGVAAE